MDPILYLAESSGDETTFVTFFAEEFLKETPEKNTLLHVAALHRRWCITERILRAHRQLLYHKNSRGDKPLHITVRVGCTEIDLAAVRDTIAVVAGQKLVLRLINVHKGEELEHPKLTIMVNLERDSALHCAVRNGHLSVVELLIKEDSELAGFENGVGESPLFLAVEKKFYGIPKHVLENLDECSLAGRDGVNALHMAVVYL